MVENLLLWQAIADTELYGSPGEMLHCESTTQTFNSTEVVAIRQMLEENYWRQDSGLVIKTPLYISLLIPHKFFELRCSGTASTFCTTKRQGSPSLCTTTTLTRFSAATKNVIRTASFPSLSHSFRRRGRTSTARWTQPSWPTANAWLPWA